MEEADVGPAVFMFRLTIDRLQICHPLSGLASWRGQKEAGGPLWRDRPYRTGRRRGRRKPDRSCLECATCILHLRHLGVTLVIQARSLVRSLI